ncbi:hypothetical protein XaplCFBP3122_06345 [Xanthomonas arboricola pv. populi]|uniref:Uncharacterized protein n=1 Tax=Xanthomonas arboricola pv. populi TaxID=487823 RepID=A0A2S6Z7P9_9XANT|nr:hypothetical protein XaplCFBP3122_06345 [Xanthomonas arboricola pv. populi]
MHENSSMSAAASVIFEQSRDADRAVIRLLMSLSDLQEHRRVVDPVAHRASIALILNEISNLVRNISYSIVNTQPFKHYG